MSWVLEHKIQLPRDSKGGVCKKIKLIDAEKLEQLEAKIKERDELLRECFSVIEYHVSSKTVLLDKIEAILKESGQ
jgi:hypothetical protein